MIDPRAGRFDELPADEPHPGVRRRSLDAHGATVTRYDFEPGARFPLHRHPQEQITLVEAGSLRMTLGDDEQELGPGGWSVVPGGIEHGIVAGPEGARFTAVVVPRRASADAYEVVGVQVLGDGEPLPIVDGDGEAVMVVGPHVGARHRTMCRLTLEPGAATVPLRHPGEAVWYVVAGTGEAVPEQGEPLTLEPGAMVHAEPGAGYTLRAGAEALHVVGGPAPPDPELARGGSGGPSGGTLRRFHRDRPSKRVPMISSDARLVVWPGVGAETANMNYVRLQPGEENVPHAHAQSEDTIVILSGCGSVDDLSNGVTLEFEAGDVIHVPVGLEHRVKADRGSGVESVGGPCPPDRAMLKAADPA